MKTMWYYPAGQSDPELMLDWESKEWFGPGLEPPDKDPSSNLWVEDEADGFYSENPSPWFALGFGTSFYGLYGPSHEVLTTWKQQEQTDYFDGMVNGELRRQREWEAEDLHESVEGYEQSQGLFVAVAELLTDEDGNVVFGVDLT